MKIVQITPQFCSQTYALFDPSHLSVGDIVESDIYIKQSSKFAIIIEAKTELTQKLYNLLFKHDKLYVLDNGNDDKTEAAVTCTKLLHHIKMSKYSLKESLEVIYDVNSNLFKNFMNSNENKIDINCVQSIVSTLVFLMQQNKDYLKDIKPNLHNNYQIEVHSLNVTIYALYIGYCIGISQHQLLQLGTAALLHDVGKKLIMNIVNKKTALENYELEDVKKHSQYSVDIAKQNDITDTTILDAIMQHHERNNGAGYPLGLGEKAISYFASILAVSDVYDALTVDRPHREQYSSFESLKILINDALSEGMFNEEYIKLLLV